MYYRRAAFCCAFFCGQKNSMQRIFIKKYFLFTVGSVCRVKRFTTAMQTFRWWRRGWDGDAEVTETTIKKLLCCGFRHSCKAMRQEYQLSICGLFTKSPSYYLRTRFLALHIVGKRG
jgi:hypothetical protein